MTLDEIAQELNLVNRTNVITEDREVTGGYTGDLLSCVMAGAQERYIWVTIQSHPNIIAVASLLGLSGIIVAEGVDIPQETIGKADQHSVPLLSTMETCFTVSGRLFEMGIKGESQTD